MDYQFKRDLYARHTAKLSMGHEAFGYWLTDEISSSAQKIQTVLKAIDAIQSQSKAQLEIKGQEFDLQLDRFQAQVAHHRVIDNGFDDYQDEESDELNDYEQELKAECGFEDFVGMFEAWVEFVAG